VGVSIGSISLQKCFLPISYLFFSCNLFFPTRLKKTYGTCYPLFFNIFTSSGVNECFFKMILSSSFM